MNVEELKEELRRDESLRLKPYKCSAGHWICGFGHNLEAAGYAHEEIDALQVTGITKAQAEQWLEDDIKLAVERAKLWLGPEPFEQLAEARQRVAVNMAYNLGTRLFGFKKTKSFILAADFEKAAVEMLDSRWAEQVGERAKRLAKTMRQG